MKLHFSAIHLTFLLAFALDCNFALAQSQVEAFAEKAASSLVSFEYDYSADTPTKIRTGGWVKVQGDMFTMSGAGLRVWCDGQSRWTMDELAEELVIEPVYGSSDYAGNPALMVCSAAQAFTIGDSVSTSFRGVSAVRTALTPNDKSTGISSLSLYFSGETLVGAVIMTQGRDRAELGISKLTFSPPVSKDEFVPDVSSLGSSWVITDLR